MLFELEPLTPQEEAAMLGRFFAEAAMRNRVAPEPGHVPVEVLEAYGDLNTHLRYMLEASAGHRRDRESKRRLRRVEVMLDALPGDIMATLPATTSENWTLAYRKLIRLHRMLCELNLGLDAEEHHIILHKMATLAERISLASAVEVSATSMFALLLIQEHLNHAQPVRKKSPRRRKSRTKKRSSRAKTTARSTKSKTPPHEVSEPGLTAVS